MANRLLQAGHRLRVWNRTAAKAAPLAASGATVADTPAAAVRDADVSYRQIYDLVRGKNFVAGYGEDGYRVNVRSFIKRIRQKFREVDETFTCIGNYPGFGYRWVDPE